MMKQRLQYAPVGGCGGEHLTQASTLVVTLRLHEAFQKLLDFGTPLLQIEV